MFLEDYGVVFGVLSERSTEVHYRVNSEMRLSKSGEFPMFSSFQCSRCGME